MERVRSTTDDVCFPHRLHCARLRWGRKAATASTLRELTVWSIYGTLGEADHGIEVLGVQEVLFITTRRRLWR